MRQGFDLGWRLILLKRLSKINQYIEQNSNALPRRRDSYGIPKTVVEDIAGKSQRAAQIHPGDQRAEAGRKDDIGACLAGQDWRACRIS